MSTMNVAHSTAASAGKLREWPNRRSYGLEGKSTADACVRCACISPATKRARVAKFLNPLIGDRRQRVWPRRGEWQSTGAAAIAALASAEKKSGVRSAGETPAAELRRILAAPGVQQGPACYDALSAKLVEAAGFGYAFVSGFAVSAVRLGAPDIGLMSYGEVVDQCAAIASAVSIPVIGDGDTGYGNALNVKRTVKGFIQAGLAGILIEDQVSPKSCGHFEGKRVVPREEALIRIKAAVDARSEAQGDIVIIARSDARQALSLKEALWRVENFARLGADVLFIDALTSKDEMLAFCKVAPNTPKMANMLEGGGRTPILSPFELEELGFKLVAYPLSLLGVSIRAMQNAMKALKSGRLPPPGDLPSFDEIKEVVGIGKFYKEDERYSSVEIPPRSTTDSGISDLPAATPQAIQEVDDVAVMPTSDRVQDGIPILADDEPVGPVPEAEPVVVEPDVVLDPKETTSVGGARSAIWSRVLRVKITGTDGSVKLDVRIPAGFLDGLSSTIPAVSGLNLQQMLDDALLKLKGSLENGRQLLDVRDRRGDRIQVFLE